MGGRHPAVFDGEVDTGAIARQEATRREAVGLGIALTGAAVAVTGIPALLASQAAFARAADDAAILSAAIGLEQQAAFTYRFAAESGLLDSVTRRVAERFAAHEQEHADELSAALRRLGGTPPGKVGRPEDVAVAGLSDVGDQRELIGYAIELESVGVAAYYDALSRLRDPRLVATAASIMANEGQHLVVLRQAAGREPVPFAFSTGGGPSRS